MKKLTYIWLNADKILIALLAATFTLNIRKVFLTQYSFLNGTFNEYLTISLSWADILIISIIFIYTINITYKQVCHAFEKYNLYNNTKHYLSIFSRLPISRETILFALLLLWIGLSIIWSPYKSIAIYRSIIFLELFTFSFIAIKLLNDKNMLGISLLLIVFNGLFQSLLGIAQFIHNGSLGFQFIGESVIGPNADGVAKILINGEKYVRAYGTLPHPNILAGFLLFPIFVLISGITTTLKNKSNPKSSVPRETVFKNISLAWLVIFLIIILIGFFLAFSRSALIGLILGLLIFLFFNKNLLLGFRSGKKSKVSFILLFVLIFTILFYLISKTSLLSNQSIKERVFYQNVSYETISNHPVTGIGIGQFVFFEFFQNPSIPGWQYQPVHNIALLISSELGMVGLILFLFLSFILISYPVIKKKQEKGEELTYIPFYCIMISYFIIACFDHYFWDIKIGMIIFSFAVIFFTLSSKKKLKTSLYSYQIKEHNCTQKEDSTNFLYAL